jgi:general secretion pathway protein D
MKSQPLRAGLLTALLAAVFARPSLAQNDQVLFTPNFQDTDIQTVIQVVADATGRRIIADTRARGATVTFYNQDPMTADELWRAFQQMLQAAGFAAIPSEDGTLWRIVADANLRSEATPIGAGPQGAEIVTRSVPVDNLGANQIVPLLRPLMAQSENLAAAAGSNVLVITGRADNVDRIAEITRTIDAAGAQDVVVVPLEYAAAADVAQQLTTVVQAQAQATAGLVSLQAIPSERTNSVILTGTQAQVDRYRPMVEALDRPANRAGGSSVRYLYYADAEEVAMTLQDLFGGTQVVENAETAASVTGGDISVLPDVGTNSLVIRAPSVVLQDMLEVVDRLDIPRAQVHIQAIIVEMSDSRAAELGLTWAIDGAGGNQAAVLTNFSGTVGGILQLAQVGAGDTPDPTAIGDGASAAVGNLSDSGTSWAAVVSALRGDGETNIMQLPELVVLDNEEGLITVGQNVPFRTGEYTNAGQGAGGAVNPFSTIQRQDVGTSLTITPRINEGTGMRLSIIQEVSSLTSSSIASDVITNKRRIETQVFVNDGDILVLGGLTDDQLRSNEQRVPGLGRIPGLRWLFRARNSERNKSNLMVFIHPTILRDSLAASLKTSERYNAILEEQRQRAEKPVPLMKDADRPQLPPLDDAPRDEARAAPADEQIPPFDTPPSLNEITPDNR